ncbi:hypothetical protein QUF74_06895 [Candidatus Halobeggiatoa sp. HSG11]|nr:hypothetical protein [Candidatus Halobeggiatoa sp. HSG11]
MKQLAELVHYYEVRMLALTEYSSRIWNRFNWFLTLELAIFGFFFTHLETLSKNFISIVPIIGIVIAALWFLIGFEDHKSMKRHSETVNELDLEIRKFFAEHGINFELKVKKHPIRFRQIWVLFMFPLIVGLSWVFFIF